MTKKFSLLFLLLPLFLAGCTKINTPAAPQVSALDNKTILFYGSTCPHCQIVEQYLDDHKIYDKMTIDKKEVYQDKDNANLMMEAVRRCSLSQNNVGVPFLWVENKCLVGDEEVTNYFKTKFNL